MTMKHSTLFLLLILATLLTACGGSGSSEADGSTGKDLFNQSVIGTQAGCATCHSLQADVVIIGPSLAGIGARAATIVSGQPAETYLKDSITAPDAHIAEGYPAGIMPQGYAQELTEEQIDQLVAYMLSLK